MIERLFGSMVNIEYTNSFMFYGVIFMSSEASGKRYLSMIIVFAASRPGKMDS